MADGLLDLAARLFGGEEERVHGVAVAQVVDNIDASGEARVQVSLPWLSGVEPWARVAVAAAGSERGLFLIPQVGDEVLVAFEHGDVTAPYVVGSLWNGVDKPPTSVSSDARDKVILKTAQGHEIELDDVQQSLKITTPSGHTITAEPTKIELEAGSAKVTLEQSGRIVLDAENEIALKANSIKLDGTSVDVQAKSGLTLNASGTCTVKGATVLIN